MLNLYLLYLLYKITPSTVNFMVSNEGHEVLTVNLPICMVTNVGGAALMMMVNGVTWYNMLRAYFKLQRKNAEKRP